MSYRPCFTITAPLLTLLTEIAVFREKILSETLQLPWIPALQKDARTRNTHSSTAIEGNPLTLDQVRLLEEGKPLVGGPQRASREVLNYFAGLRFIEKRVNKKRIAHEEILKLHKIIASDVMDQGVDQVSGLMAELLEWWNNDSSDWSPVITSGILHFRFEEIHPFADGNGRTGRALALWELYRRGFDTHHIFSVDEAYWENRPRYYSALNEVRKQGGDLTGWLEYTAEALHLTLEKVWIRVQQLIAGAGLQKIVLRPKQEQLLQMLRDRNGLTPREIWEGIGISGQGAMNLLNPLLTVGLVCRIGTKKSGKYFLSSSVNEK